jgi:hypothetical protein
MTCRRPYDTDLTDREWEQLRRSYLGRNRAAGRRYTADRKS